MKFRFEYEVVDEDSGEVFANGSFEGIEIEDRIEFCRKLDDFLKQYYGV